MKGWILLAVFLFIAKTGSSSSSHQHDMTKDNDMNMPDMAMGDTTATTSTTASSASTSHDMTSEMSMQHMLSSFNTNWSQQTVLFSQWNTGNPAMYVMSLLVLFALSVAHEVLTVAQTRYDERVYKQRKQALDRRATEQARLLNDAQFAEKQQQRKQDEEAEAEELNRIQVKVSSHSLDSSDSCCGGVVDVSPMHFNRHSTDDTESTTNLHSIQQTSTHSQITPTIGDDHAVQLSSSSHLSVNNCNNNNNTATSLTANELQKSLKFASEHLKQQRPLHCQTQIATVSSSMAGSSILTLSTSSCATASTLYFRYTNQQQFIRTLFYLFRTFLMFVLMVLFMTLDVGFVAAILTGMSVGYFLFSNRAGTSVSIHH